MRIVFDEGWLGLAKKVTFWNSRGENPVVRTLTVDLLTNQLESLLDYTVPIPAEPLEYEGEATYVIDGYFVKELIENKTVLTVRTSISSDTNIVTVNEPITATEATALKNRNVKIGDTVYTITSATAGTAGNASITLDSNISSATANDYIYAADGSRRRSVSDKLNVIYSPKADNANEPVDPTPSQAEQLQVQIDTILEDVTEQAQIAVDAAETATEQATIATAQANIATAAAQTATEQATLATDAAQTATTKANEAQASATSAAASASSATISANSASEAARIATEKAAEVAEATTTTEGASLAAIQAAATATEKAKEAKESATSATNAATSANADATTASNAAIEAKSYTVGGTGTRDDEDTDNAKFYMEQAKAIAGGDYVTNYELNLRVNQIVLPLTNDVETLNNRIDGIEDEIEIINSDLDTAFDEIEALKYADIQTNATINNVSAKTEAMWDALFNDITENPLLVDFDDLTGFILAGGVWNKPLRRLEV